MLLLGKDEESLRLVPLFVRADPDPPPVPLLEKPDDAKVLKSGKPEAESCTAAEGEGEAPTVVVVDEYKPRFCGTAAMVEGILPQSSATGSLMLLLLMLSTDERFMGALGGGGGRAAALSTRTTRPSKNWPLILFNASSASFSSMNVTNPKPLDLPVSRSFTTFASITSPNLLKAVRRPSSSVVKERPPTKRRDMALQEIKE